MKNFRKIFFIILVILFCIGSYFVGFINAKIKYVAPVEVASQKTDTDFMDEKTSKTLRELLNTIHNEYYKDIKNDTLNEGILRGIVESLKDPYSTYMNEKDYKKFMESTNGEYVGVGIVVSPAKDGFITVVSPIKGSPADKAGIKSNDRILKVNGVEYSSDTMQDAVNVMRGKEGEKVKLTISRIVKDKPELLYIEIVRKKIKLETVTSKMLESKIGYIGISEFDKPTYNDFVKQYKELKKSGMKSLIIDLRGNPGGLLDVCADIADYFLDKGTIVYTKYKNGEKDYYYSDDAKENLPIVVLVNGGSASASEILSGAFQDRKRAKLIGTTTYGKGIVQRIFSLNSNQAVKLTVSEYFTPNGKNIHGVGIEPDIVLELNEDAKGIGVDHIKEDNQLQKAIEVLKEGAK